MDPSVTVKKSHLEALIRRAEPIASGNGRADQMPGMVTITAIEYIMLKKAETEYATLRSALFRGGLTEAALDVLVSDTNNGQVTTAFASNANDWDATVESSTLAPLATSLSTSGQLSSYAQGHDGDSRRSSVSKSTKRYGSFAEAQTSPPTNQDLSPIDTSVESIPPFPRNDRRTLHISGLHEKTTHKDLTDAVRGGRLLDVHLRNDRSAAISFVEGAAEFLAYAKRNDIYIRSKRVEVRWSERQFQMPGHIANKIANGATRNLVIRGAAAKLTEDKIREDMEHIHNLVIIDVTVKKDDIFVSTNSVHNCLFARTCMMSRTGYKGYKIAWSSDECAAPLPKSLQASYSVPSQQARQATPAAKQTKPSNPNMFAVLAVDQDDESENEELDDLRSGGVPVPFGARINWADTAVAT